MGFRLSQSEYNIHTPAHQSPLPQSWQRWSPCRVELTPVRKSGVCQTTVNDQSLPGFVSSCHTKRTYNFFDLLTDSIKPASNNRLQKRACIFQNRIKNTASSGQRPLCGPEPHFQAKLWKSASWQLVWCRF